MTDLDIQTAQLIIQLARDDLYQLDDDDFNQTDLEFALAEQEREFMQYWTDYGDAQVNNNPNAGNGRNAGGIQGGANANTNGASSTSSSLTAPRPHDTQATPTGSGLAQATQATPPRFHEPARAMSVPVQQVDDDDDDDDDGLYINPYEPTPGASSSRAPAVIEVHPTSIGVPAQPADDPDDPFFRPPMPSASTSRTYSIPSTSRTATASGSGGLRVVAVQEPQSDEVYDDFFEFYHRHLHQAATEEDASDDEVDTTPHLISFDDWNLPLAIAPIPSPPRLVGVQAATEDGDDRHRLVSLPDPPVASIPSPPRLVALRVASDDEPSDDEDAGSVYVYDTFLDPSVECYFCKEQCPMSTTINTPCDHHLCQACITRLMELCIKDETAYPPKCCDNKLLTDHIQSVAIDANLQRQYESKVYEYETPIRVRVYCHRCGDFLDSSSSTVMTGASTSAGTVIHSSKYCGTCFVRTCISCKQATHPMRPCQETPEELALKNLAKVKGWQTCPDCKTVVELKAGCYHMTCRCTAQFCYLCAAKWKVCNCPAFEEERLLAMAA